MNLLAKIHELINRLKAPRLTATHVKHDEYHRYRKRWYNPRTWF